MVNETLVREGYAQVATFPPNVRYESDLLSAQSEAQAEGAGIWGLGYDQQQLLEDRGNGIGGGCMAESTPTPSASSSATASATASSSATASPEPDPGRERRGRRNAGPAVPPGGDVDCSDFASEAEAAPYLLPGDPYDLDGDNDGRACEPY